MSSIPISIPEDLVEIISIFEYLDSNQLIKIQSTEKFNNKVIFQSFKVNAIEKSLKDLERKAKVAIPELTNSQYIAIESAIYEELNKIVALQNGDNNVVQSSKDIAKTFQLRKYVFDGKVYESILVDNRPYFVTSDELGNGYSLEERIEVAGNTFLPQDSLTTVNPLPYKFESEEELKEYFAKARKETFDSLYEKVLFEFKKYVNVPEPTRVVLSADILYSYFQDKFGTTHYNIFIGENGSGKNSALLVLKHLGYRVFYVTAASAPNYFTFLGDILEGQGTIAEDEADDIGENKDKQRILKTGYASGGTVPKIEFSKNGTRSQKPYLTFCHKWLAMEEIPDERNIRGVLDRSFIFKFLVGDIQYNIKDVVKDEDSELFKKISDLRKTLFVFKILHHGDEFKDIKLNIKNRNAELTKPLLRLFSGSKCLEPIRKSLSVLINEKSKLKSNSTESKILEALNELVSNNSKDFKEVYQFTNEEIFKAVRRTMDGSDNNWDDYMDSTIITSDGMDISKKKITQILKSKFNAVPDKINEYGRTKRVVRVNKSWLEKLGKQYEVIDEIRILDSNTKNERHCEPDTMTDMTLIENTSTDLEKENETSMDKEIVHTNELIIKNISIDNSLTNSKPAPVTSCAGSGSTEVDYNPDNEIIDKTEYNDDDKQLQELDKINESSSNYNPNSNILASEIVTSKKLENHGQALSESVISVISVRNSASEPNLKEYDNDTIDFGSLREIAMDEFQKIESKQGKHKKGFNLVGRIKFRNALLKNPKVISMKVLKETADRIIIKLVRDGKLAEPKKGQYYRITWNSSNNSAAADATAAA